MSKKIKMTKVEQKDVLLEMLIEFDNYCQKNNLNYFLDAGTLLGAVRHKGFIPWDDDIDINMPRKDYNKLINLVKKNNGMITDVLRVDTPYETIYPYLKIVNINTILVEFPNKYPLTTGIYIDLFPKDGIKQISLFSKFICWINSKLRLWQWFNKFSIFAWKKEKNIVKRLISFLGIRMIKNPNLPIKIQEKLISWYNHKNPIDDCKYVTTLIHGEFKKIAPKECFDQYQLLEFEGHFFRCPIDYDTYLRCLYSDNYMQLPPLEERIAHDTKIFWKSEEVKYNFYRKKE